MVLEISHVAGGEANFRKYGIDYLTVEGFDFICIFFIGEKFDYIFFHNGEEFFSRVLDHLTVDFAVFSFTESIY